MSPGIPRGDYRIERRADLLFERRGRVLRPLDVQIEEAASRFHKRASAQKLPHRCRIERSRHDDQPQIGAFRLLESSQECKREIRFEMAFVKLVEHDGADAAEFRICNEAARENAFRQETQARARPGRILKANLIAHCFPDRFAHLTGHPARSHAGGNATRFEHENAASERQQGGRHTRGLAGARSSFNHQIGRLAQTRECRAAVRRWGGGRWRLSLFSLSRCVPLCCPAVFGM
jgi:hypothetical protein